MLRATSGRNPVDSFCDMSAQMFAAAAQAQGGPTDPAAPPLQLQQQQQQQQAPAAAPQMPSPAYNGIAEQGLPPRKRKAPGRD